MKRFPLPFGLLALAPALFALPALADDPPPPPGCNLSDAFLVSQDQGSVTINCNGVSEAFGTQLAEVLTRILQNRLDPQVVLGKLEEVESVPADGVARQVDELQRQAIIAGLVGKPTEQVAIMAHPQVDDSAEYAKAIAGPLSMVGWQIEGQQIRRAAPKALDPVRGVAIIVHDRDAPPKKAVELRVALSAAHIVAPLLTDPGMPGDGTLLWIGRRPVFMQTATDKP